MLLKQGENPGTECKIKIDPSAFEKCYSKRMVYNTIREVLKIHAIFLNAFYSNSLTNMQIYP